MAVVNLMMKVSEMPNAKTGDFENEYRVTIPDHLGIRIVTEIAPDIGGHVANEHIAHAKGDFRRLSVLAPAVQHVRNAGIRKERVMRAVGAVHGHHVGHAPCGVGAAVIGRDPHAARRVDVIGRVAGIGDRDLIPVGRRLNETDRLHARPRIRHRQAFAAAWALLRRRRSDKRAEEGNNDSDVSQHGKARLEKTPHSIAQRCFRHRGNLRRARIHSRCGLIFHVAARIAAVMRPVMSAPIGRASASAPVAAHPIEEKASANVASRDEVWRRRNWLRRACTRNHSWIAVAEAAATMTPSAVTTACGSKANSSANISGANIRPIAISTTSILVRIMRDGDSGALVTRSAASSPEIVSHARPPASWPAAITTTGVISTMASVLSAKLRHSITAGGTRYSSCIRLCDTSHGSRRSSTNSFRRSACRWEPARNALAGER